MNIRCPRCTTLFVATDEVIQASHGLVRCSRCRNVFKATDHQEGVKIAERVNHLPAWLRGELLSQLAENSVSARRLRLVFSWLLVIGLSAVLLAQVGYSQLAHVSQINSLRPALEQVCRALSCQLPPFRQLDLIRLVNSQIFWHGQDSIQLKIAINNESSFDQSYPVVHIMMSNHLSQIVAEGRFRPSQYASDNGIVAAGDTVEVDLMIDNPGQRIRSYEISFF